MGSLEHRVLLRVLMRRVEPWRSSERAPVGTLSGDADAAGGWLPSLTLAFAQMIRLLAFALMIVVAGCTNVPQAGTYRSAATSFGRPVLKVLRNGKIEEKDGPLVRRGTWSPISEVEIRAEVQALEKHTGVRFYRLERSNWTYRGAFSLQELKRLTERDGPANRSQPIRVETHRTSVAAGSDR
jgi:hypothetical protein